MEKLLTTVCFEKAALPNIFAATVSANATAASVVLIPAQPYVLSIISKYVPGFQSLLTCAMLVMTEDPVHWRKEYILPSMLKGNTRQSALNPAKVYSLPKRML